MAGAEIFVIFTMFLSALRPAEPPIQWVMGGGSWRKKYLGHTACHSLASSAAI